MEDDGGSVIPSTVSAKGSLYPPGMPSGCCRSSWEDIESSRMRSCCRVLERPTLVCFLLKTFERGLSMVDAEEPDARDGVRELRVTSSFGSFDVDAGFAILGGAATDSEEVIGEGRRVGWVVLGFRTNCLCG